MLIKRLTLKKILSFRETTVDLQQLNVLIGPNAVGKSNLIEAISLLQAAPTGIEGQILRGGGVRQWLWLSENEPAERAEVECELTLPPWRQLSYRLDFLGGPPGFEILHERLMDGPPGPDAQAYFMRSDKGVRFGARAPELAEAQPAGIAISPKESVLARFKSLADTTPITDAWSRIASQGGDIDFGPEGLSAGGQRKSGTRAPRTRLLGWACSRQGVSQAVLRSLRRCKGRRGRGTRAALPERNWAIGHAFGNPHVRWHLEVSVPPRRAVSSEAGASGVHRRARTRGLHPDALRLVAEMLVESSERTQLIVTTHSEALIDALTDRPESVLVCERDFENGTQFQATFA